MRTTVRNRMAGVVFLVLCGCATQEPAFIPLSKDLSQRINSSNAVIVASQKEIVADVDKSQVAAVMGGGLIPALIDVAIEKSRASSAEELIRPIRDALVEFDMGKDLREALGTRLDSIAWLHLVKWDTTYDNRADHIPTQLAANKEDVLVLITPGYALSSDFQSLRVESEVKVIPRAASLRVVGGAKGNNEKVEPLYKVKVSHLAPLAVGGTDKEGAAKEWSKDGGVRIKEYMKQGVSSIADKIVESLTHPERAPLEK